MNKYYVVKTSDRLHIMLEDRFNPIKRIAATINITYDLIESFDSKEEANGFIIKYKENIEFS